MYILYILCIEVKKHQKHIHGRSKSVNVSNILNGHNTKPPRGLTMLDELFSQTMQHEDIKGETDIDFDVMVKLHGEGSIDQYQYVQNERTISTNNSDANPLKY